MTTQCAWCVSEGLMPLDMDASHGICDRHQRELLIESPLQGVIGQLRSCEFLGEPARDRLAGMLETVVRRSQKLAERADETTVRPALACPRCLTDYPPPVARPGDQTEHTAAGMNPGGACTGAGAGNLQPTDEGVA